MKKMKKKHYIALYMTARYQNPDDVKDAFDVTVLVGDMDLLMFGPPELEVALEFDGEDFTAQKKDLSDIRFCTRKGTEARLQPVMPCLPPVYLTKFDRRMQAIMKSGQFPVLDSNKDRNVYILPALLPDGRVEYQVSDELDGKRGNSVDFYCYKDAKKAFDEICEVGWGEWGNA